MAAKYRAYAEYKDSGVEWLGAIPAHWEVKRLKHISPKIGVGLVINPSTYTKEEGNYFIFGSEVKEFGFDLSHSRRITQKDSDQLFQSRLSHLDLVSVRVGNPGLTAVVTKELEGANCASIMIIRKGNFNSYWLCAAMNSSVGRRQVEACAYGAAQKQFNISDAIDFIFPTPCNSEAEQIANFLDHETAKIDVLIEKQQQLIALLKEKRQAVISHAVTKGLNPNVKMKDSGVEWLGDVPEHWKVAQLKFNTLEMQTGPFGSQLHAEDYIENGTPLINPAHMSEGKIIPDLKVTVDKLTCIRLDRHQLKIGDLILARRGELGRCAVIRKEHEGWLCGTGSLKATLNKKLLPDYAYLLITSEGVIAELALESKGSTMDNLNTETLGRIRVPIPPIKEQEDILSYVEIIADKFKLLVEKTQQQIELLQERRTALISAAVTGKIDVRDWQANT
ncbi:MAG: restriction endonuclease subunit S [Thiothrix sp.]|nr:MAG: restriction endonuclease subunit S [Thiothrix sp.]